MIKVEHLTKQYGERYAVNDISFEVKKGEIVGFLGPNGAGKSTTMNILTGYLSSTSGRAMVDGLDILEHPLAVKKKIGFLPETPPLYLEMTVKEYLNFIYDLKKCTLNRKEHIEEICRVVKIEDTMNRMIRNLSKGYRQRVGIAGAIVGNPEVIIFDEPTNGLDPKQIIDIRSLIRELGKERTIILSTHILSEVKAVCDRILIINEGKIVADEKTENIESAIRGNRRLNIHIDGPTASVLPALKKINGVIYANVAQKYEDGSALYIVESKNNIDVRKPIFYMLAQNSWPIMSLAIKGSDLEDIFISVVDEAEAQAASEK
ncbi:MAG: ATP-binding cassette domain-containing protein [Clostridia bacterium]|nr:ATP-binding cassette domain-containing protein [Clostridia bacterium]MBP3555842.1 ATP-binding cassette domain-containing protein [Clostridia bacterium]MBQ8420421.1 ATP-binding cassette domain-containing protein [Clostridia bacterium]